MRGTICNINDQYVIPKVEYPLHQYRKKGKTSNTYEEDIHFYLKCINL
jgi:hypothetical protein